jgi:hypothetical protein
LFFPFLQSDVIDISSGKEPACQKDPPSEAPEDPLTTVNPLLNLQDPVDASSVPRDLQESVVAASDISPSLEEPTVTSSTISLPSKGARLQEPIIASSAVTLLSERVSLQEPIITSSAVIAAPPERAHPQEPIITSSAVVAPPPEQVCFSHQIVYIFSLCCTNLMPSFRA